jgi:hypothetical protein
LLEAYNDLKSAASPGLRDRASISTLYASSINRSEVAGNSRSTPDSCAGLLSNLLENSTMGDGRSLRMNTFVMSLESLQ